MTPLPTPSVLPLLVRLAGFSFPPSLQDHPQPNMPCLSFLIHLWLRGAHCSAFLEQHNLHSFSELVSPFSFVTTCSFTVKISPQGQERLLGWWLRRWLRKPASHTACLGYSPSSAPNFSFLLLCILWGSSSRASDWVPATVWEPWIECPAPRSSWYSSGSCGNLREWGGSAISLPPSFPLSCLLQK